MTSVRRKGILAEEKRRGRREPIGMLRGYETAKGVDEGGSSEVT